MKRVIDTDLLELCVECTKPIRPEDTKVVLGAGQNRFFVLHPECETEAAKWIYGTGTE